MSRKFRAWYTHEILELSLAKIQKYAREYGVKLVDKDNPTPQELSEVFKATFEEMSDPWEITANGDCKVEEMDATNNSEDDEDEDEDEDEDDEDFDDEEDDE